VSESELQQVEEPVMRVQFVRALEFLLQSAPPEKEGEVRELVERLRERARAGDRIDMGEVVAELLDPEGIGLEQGLVEEFLRLILGGRPDADRLIAGTLEYAKRRVWRRRERG